MQKIRVFIVLFTCYIVYSGTVYTYGTESLGSSALPEKEQILNGKNLYQQYNCVSCHQIYGLGGFLGPELTTAYSDKARGEQYMRAFLMAGGPRMPNFHLKENEVSSIISYLKYVDSTASNYKILFKR